METVRVKHEFTARDKEDIPYMRAGEEIIVLEHDKGFEDGWWKGRSLDGQRVGLFPSNFVSACVQGDFASTDGYEEIEADTRQSHHESNRNAAIDECDEDADNNSESFTVISTDDCRHSIYSSSEHSGYCSRPSSLGAYHRGGLSPLTPLSSADQESSPGQGLSQDSISPYSWTVNHVANWLCSIPGFQQYEREFRENEMDGLALLSPFLDVNSLKDLGIHVLERRLTLMTQIARLRKRADAILFTQTVVEPFSKVSGETQLPLEPKSPHRLEKTRSQTVNYTAKIPQNIQTLADVLELDLGKQSQIDHQGYLWKRGGHAYWSWKRRFFILKQMTMWYFKSDDPSARVLGLIILPSYQILPADNANLKSGVYSFVAAHPDARTYWFRAESLDDMNTWMGLMVRSSLGLSYNSSEPEPLSSTSTHLDSTVCDKTQVEPEMNQKMNEIVSQLKEMQWKKKRIPPAIPKKPSHLSSATFSAATFKSSSNKFPVIAHSRSEIASPQSAVKMTTGETNSRASLIRNIELKPATYYINWINKLLENTFMDPIQQLSTDIPNGEHLMELVFHMRSMLNSSKESEALIAQYKELISSNTQNKLDNVQLCWKFIENEIDPLTETREANSIIETLSSLKVTPQGICHGNLEQILLLLEVLRSKHSACFSLSQ